MKDLPGRVAVVTGGGSGIGAGSVRALVRRGIRCIVADIDRERAAAVAEQVSDVAAEAVAIGVACDVTSQDDLQAVRDLALERFGRVDIVMNNVAMVAQGLPLDIPMDVWATVLDVNVLSIVRSNAVFLPHLLHAGDGHIVNTASINGLFPYCYDRLPYTASKAAVVALSEALALYLVPRGVGITCLCPGPVHSGLAQATRRFGEQSAFQVAPMLEKMDPENVGEMVAEAIETDQFFVLTHPQVADSMVARAADPGRYLAGALAERARAERRMQ